MTEYMENGTPVEAGNDAVAEVVIDGKVFPLTGGDTGYMQKVAAYIDGKIAALRKTRQFSRQNAEYRTVMIWLNLADDYFREKEKADSLRADRDSREGEIYSLKRELVEKRLAAENAEKKLSEALAKIEEAEKRAAEAGERAERCAAEAEAEAEKKAGERAAEAETLAERKLAELRAEADRRVEDVKAEAEKRIAEVRAEAARKAADLEEETGRELAEMRRSTADEKAEAALRAEAAERESRELLAEAERKYEDAMAKIRELESQVDELLEK